MGRVRGELVMLINIEANFVKERLTIEVTNINLITYFSSYTLILLCSSRAGSDLGLVSR